MPYEVTAEKLMFSVSSNHKVKRGNERKKEKKKKVEQRRDCADSRDLKKHERRTWKKENAMAAKG